MTKKNRTSQMGTNKSAEINAREASKRMGLEFGNEFGSEEMGARFAEAPGKGVVQGPSVEKSPSANQKRNRRKNNK